FRPRKDTVMLHLGHPVFRQALSALTRARFPGGSPEYASSRWIVSTAPLPGNVDAIILLTVEEMAVNDLRETFHHWTRTLALPVKNGALGEPLPSADPSITRVVQTKSESLVDAA